MAGAAVPYSDNAETYTRFSFQEYEDHLTPEARFVKGMNDQFLFDHFSDGTRDLDLDRFELASQGGFCVQDLANIADYAV